MSSQLLVLLFCFCHGSYLADTFYKKPVMIYNYPKEAKPFYTRWNDDGTVAAFDLVVPKVLSIVTAGVVVCVDGLVHTCVWLLSVDREHSFSCNFWC